MSATIEIKLLKDGSGRVCIHWFEHLPEGPATTPSGVTMSAIGPIKMGGAKGRIACRPTLSDVTPHTVGGITYPVVHSDDVRAVTCPLCQATPEYQKVAKHLAELAEAASAR